MATDVDEGFDFVVFVNDRAKSFDCFAVNKIDCRKAGLIIS
jgi:hypothetical protein